MTPSSEAAGAGRAAGDRTWTVGSRVRFDEAGPDGFARPSVLLAMAQDWTCGAPVHHPGQPVEGGPDGRLAAVLVDLVDADRDAVAIEALVEAT